MDNIHLRCMEKGRDEEMRGQRTLSANSEDGFVIKLVYQPDKGMFDAIRDLNPGTLHLTEVSLFSVLLVTEQKGCSGDRS